MKLKAKDIDVATGGVPVVILNQDDATKLDIHHLDRLHVTKNGKSTVAVVDIAESEKTVKKGEIGLMEEVIDALGAKGKDIIKIKIARKPESVFYIKQKLDGKTLNYKQIHEIIDDISNNRLTDIELTTFVTSYYVHPTNMKEIADITKAMIETGDKMTFPKDKKIVDMHSIGGVPNNRTTMIVVPILTAAGYTFPKTSSRAITSPAGTADTMEVLCNVSFRFKTLKTLLKKAKGFIVWGGSVNLAPADDKIIQVERPLSIDSEAQMLASIMSKKASVGATHLIMEIPVGRETKVKTMAKAEKLKKMFISLGRKIGMKVKVLICQGNEPVGNGIGPILEVKDVLWILKNDEKGPVDLRNKSLMIAGDLIDFVSGGKTGRKKAKEILESGKAYEAFMKIVKAQGGKEVNPSDLHAGKYHYTVLATKKGYLRGYENEGIAKIARLSGAPRDKSAGILLYVKAKDKVKNRQPLFTIYSNSKTKLKYAVDALNNTKTFDIRSKKNHS